MCVGYALAVAFDVVVAIFDQRRALEWLGGAGTDVADVVERAVRGHVIVCWRAAERDRSTR